MKVAFGAASVVTTCFALVIGLATISAGGGGSVANAAVAPLCVTNGALPGLSPTAASNARIVTAVAEQMSGSSAAVVAVMAGYTESGLRALGNSSVPGSGGPGQGQGSDHDSVGIFQERASWGTLAQRLDPAQSTRLFLIRLLRVSHWRDEPPWAVAQDVERSAYDGHPRAANHGSSVYGGNYRAHFRLARRIVARIDRDVATHPCGTLTGGLPASTVPGSHGLPTDYTLPPSATSAEARVVLFAIKQLDKPYVFGAAGPSAYDCSGLTMVAWRQAGVSIPHSAAAQAHSGAATTAAALTPGDLVLVPGDDGTLAAPGHVGVYIGRGLVLNAADSRDGIRVQTLANFIKVGHGLAALRHIE